MFYHWNLAAFFFTTKEVTAELENMAFIAARQKKKTFLWLCVDLLSLDQSKTFYKPDWFDIVGEEVKCCKEAVCVIDMSSFTKFEVTVSPTAI